jgi:hypothetical protein
MDAFDYYRGNYSDITYKGVDFAPKMGSDIKFTISTVKGSPSKNCSDERKNYSDDNFDEYNTILAVHKTIMTCKERHVMYNVNVTFVQGVQFLNYTMRDADDQPKNLTIIPYQDSNFTDKNRVFSQMYPFLNSFALLDATLRLMITPRFMRISSMSVACGDNTFQALNITVRLKDLFWSQKPSGELLDPTQLLGPEAPHMKRLTIL